MRLINIELQFVPIASYKYQFYQFSYMKREIIIIFLVPLLNCSNISQNGEQSIIEEIVSYPHKWIGLVDCLRFRKFIAQVDSEQRPLPTEFRDRKFLLFYNYNKIRILKGYFSFPKESKIAKEFWDLVEDFYRIFFKMKTYSNQVQRVSAGLLYDIALQNITGEEDDPEDVKRIKDLKSSLSLLKQRLEENRNEPQEFLRISAELISDIMKNIPLREKYLCYFSDLSYIYGFSKLGLTEHGTQEVLKTQLDKHLDEFTKGGGLNLLAAYYIYRENINFFHLLDYVREKYASIAIEIATMPITPQRRQILLKKHQHYRSLLELHADVVSKDILTSRDGFLLCSNLKILCLSNFDEILFSTFHDICYRYHSELFKGLIDLVPH
jgi:hypothetical protein